MAGKSLRRSRPGRRRPEPDDFAALTGGEVVPETGLAALDLDHEAVAGIAVDVADEELAALEHAARKEVGENTADADQHARLELAGAFDGMSGPGAVELLGLGIVEVAPAVDIDDVAGVRRVGVLRVAGFDVVAHRFASIQSRTSRAARRYSALGFLSVSWPGR